MKAARAPQQVAAERAWLERAMARVREVLYPGASDSVFEREWPDLLRAVAEPARWMRARSRALPGARYSAILDEVLAGVKTHGDFARSRNRPRYLITCMQRHMEARGEEYLNEAKTAEAGRVAKSILRGLRPVAADPDAERLTALLDEARKLAAPPARKK